MVVETPKFGTTASNNGGPYVLEEPLAEPNYLGPMPLISDWLS